MNKIEIIENLFDYFSEIRYVAIYKESELIFKQKEQILDNPSGETDKFEELLFLFRNNYLHDKLMK